jgi:hypothetical protein
VSITTASLSAPAGADDDGPLAPVVAIQRRERQAHPAGRTRDQQRRTASAAPATAPAPARPDPGRLAELLVRVTAEVAAGRRPLSQLDALLAPTLARRLAANLRAGVPRPQEVAVVRRVVTAPPTPSGAVEATVLVERAGRVTAVAVRLERHRGAWRATELTAPEAGYAPLPTRSNPRPGRGFDAFDEAELEDRVTPARDTV